MLNVNDDMDDFLRKAASDYPLKTGKGDWDKIAGSIPAPAVTPVPPRKNKRFLWLLLPLLIVGGLSLYQNRTHTTAFTRQTAAIKSTQKKIDNNKAEPVFITGKNLENNIQTKPESIEKKEEKSQQSEKISLLRYNSKKNNLQAGMMPENNFVNQLSHNLLQSKNNALLADNEPVVINKSTAATTEPERITNNVQMQQPATTFLSGTVTSFVKKDSLDKLAANDSVNTTAKTHNKNSSPIKKTGLYAGFAVSPDATTVKFHSIKHIGFGLSFVLGYRLNNSWSIESGLMWDNKKYYSTGKYFDKSKTGLSSDYNIHYLNGDCKMFEIPLNIKHDFKSKKSSGFFLTAGLSSYLMKKEYYNYFVTHESAPLIPGYFREKDYRNATNNWFSVANLSGGYQFIFKNNSNLRIEPYFKIPLSGLGIGNLPLSSTGISAAYTLPIH